MLCFNTESIWHGKERGRAKTDADFLCLCKGNIPPRHVTFLTLAAQTSPPNLRLLLICSLIIDAYCIHFLLSIHPALAWDMRSKDSKSLSAGSFVFLTSQKSIL